MLKMNKLLSALVSASLGTLFAKVEASGNSSLVPVVVNSAPIAACDPIPEAFVSYSIELAFWPDYAGDYTLIHTIEVERTFG